MSSKKHEIHKIRSQWGRKTEREWKNEAETTNTATGGGGEEEAQKSLSHGSGLRWRYKLQEVEAA